MGLSFRPGQWEGTYSARREHAKRAAPPALLLSGIRCGNIGNLWGQEGKEECMGVLVSQPGVQFVYGGWDLHAKAVVSRIPAFFELIPYSPVHKTPFTARGCRRQKTRPERHYTHHSGRFHLCLPTCRVSAAATHGRVTGSYYCSFSTLRP